MSQARLEEYSKPITDALYKIAGGLKDYAAIRRRVKGMLMEVKDPDLVELVCSTIAEIKGSQFDVSSLSWAYFDRVGEALGYDVLMWRYANWENKQQPGSPEQLSARYWIGRYQDSEYDIDTQNDAIAQLEKLMKRQFMDNQ